MSKDPHTPASARPAPRPNRRPGSGGQPARTGQRTPVRVRHADQTERLAMLAGAAVIAIVAVLLAFGWYQTYVRPYHQTVITVGRTNVSMSTFISRLKQVLPEFSSSGSRAAIAIAPAAAKESIEQQLVLEQRAQSLGVSASNQEINSQIAKDLGIAVDAQGNSLDRAAYEAALRAKLAQTGLSYSEYRQEMAAQVLHTKVQDKLAADLPKTVPEVKYSEISMNTQADAKKILDRLNGGESWDAVVAEVRKNPSTGTVAEFDFQPKQQVDSKLAPQLFDLKAGDHTDIVNSSDGKYTIARLVEKDDNHALTDVQRKALGPKLFSNWLDEQKKSLGVKDTLNDSRQLFAINHSGYTPPPQSQQPQQAPSQNITIPVPTAPAAPAASPGAGTAPQPPARPAIAGSPASAPPATAQP